MVNQIALLPEFFLVFRLKILTALIQHTVVDVILLLFAAEIIGRILPVEAHSRFHTAFSLFLFPLLQLHKLPGFLAPIGAFRLRGQGLLHLRLQICICCKSLRQLFQFFPITVDVFFRTDLFSVFLQKSLLNRSKVLSGPGNFLLQFLSSAFQIRHQRAVLQFLQLVLQFFLSFQTFLQLPGCPGPGGKLCRILIQRFIALNFFQTMFLD